MNLRQGGDCWLVLGLSLISVGLACYEEGPVILRAVLGLPFILFCPGYALVSALFPARDELGFTIRMVLACGCSLALVPLVGLLLNYTPWGIDPVLLCAILTLMVATLGALAWLRRMDLPEDERYRPPRWPWGRMVWHRVPMCDKALGAVLVVGLAFAAGTLAWVGLHPKAGDGFTAFYILGRQGQAIDYPRHLRPGEEARVIVGVANHEGRSETYRAEVVIQGFRVAVVNPFTLGDGEEREETVFFPVPSPSPQGEARVEFQLFRLGETHPCQTLHLWVSIREGDGRVWTGPCGARA